MARSRRRDAREAAKRKVRSLDRSGSRPVALTPTKANNIGSAPAAVDWFRRSAEAHVCSGELPVLAPIADAHLSVQQWGFISQPAFTRALVYGRATALIERHARPNLTRTRLVLLRRTACPPPKACLAINFNSLLDWFFPDISEAVPSRPALSTPELLLIISALARHDRERASSALPQPMRTRSAVAPARPASSQHAIDFDSSRLPLFLSAHNAGLKTALCACRLRIPVGQSWSCSRCRPWAPPTSMGVAGIGSICVIRARTNRRVK